MTYTTCEVCGVEGYCFLQFSKNASEDQDIMIKRAVCTNCLSNVYHQMVKGTRIASQEHSLLQRTNS